ncbi:MAG: flagellar basal body rod protein FlgB [Firmicutes bacterium HGW-Firmicutes-16]|nr:MAG: flagellar basal body rod protein FlgB [Firmicutes bacterium HGW-Firmicutes-16]
MFYDSSKFKVLEAGVQLALMQQKLSTQNIANIETTGYKSKGLSFDGVLSSVQNGTDTPEISGIKASIITNDTESTQPNGNNVNLEKESITLYKAYAQYSVLLNQISSEFDKYSYVLNCNM